LRPRGNVLQGGVNLYRKHRSHGSAERKKIEHAAGPGHAGSRGRKERVRGGRVSGQRPPVTRQKGQRRENRTEEKGRGDELQNAQRKRRRNVESKRKDTNEVQFGVAG